MSAQFYADGIGVSTATTGTGTLTLGAAIAGHLAWPAAADGLKCGYRIDDGAASENGTGTFTNSGTTLTRTLVSSSTGSLLNLSGSATVKLVEDAASVTRFDLGTRGAIVGGGIGPITATTSLPVAACTLDINGTILTIAGATLTSGSTWKNLNGSTVTIGASKKYHLYAFNNAGTGEWRVQDYSEATYGGAPVFDSTINYFKSPYTTAGVNARRVACFWSNGSSQLIPCDQEVFGRFRRIQTRALAAATLVSAGTATTATAVTITPWVTADDATFMLGLSQGNSSTSANSLNVSIDGTNIYNLATPQAWVSSGYNGSPCPVTLPNIGVLYYWNYAAPPGGSSIYFCGVEEFV